MKLLLIKFTEQRFNELASESGSGCTMYLSLYILPTSYIVWHLFLSCDPFKVINIET